MASTKQGSTRPQPRQRARTAGWKRWTAAAGVFALSATAMQGHALAQALLADGAHLNHAVPLHGAALQSLDDPSSTPLPPLPPLPPQTRPARAGDSTPALKDDLFDGTERFAKGASDVTEINMDPDSLDLVNGHEARRAHGMLLNVVRTYSYDKPGMYNIADVDEFRHRLDSGDWHCSMHVRDSKHGESTDICSKRRAPDMVESAIITVQPRQLTFIHTIRRANGDSNWNWAPGAIGSLDLQGLGLSSTNLAELHAQMARLHGPEMEQLREQMKELHGPEMEQLREQMKELRGPEMEELREHMKELQGAQTEQLREQMKELRGPEMEEFREHMKELQGAQTEQLREQRKELQKSLRTQP